MFPEDHGFFQPCEFCPEALPAATAVSLKLAQTMAGHSVEIRVQQEALCERGVGVPEHVYRYHSQVWPLSSEMVTV